jgi:putative redox protein
MSEIRETTAAQTPAILQWAGNDYFIATSPTGHAVTIDFSSTRTKTAPGPLEYFLAGAAACTASDVISILQKKRQDVTGYRVEIRNERREEHPRSFRRVELKHIVRGRNISEEAVARAVELSTTKYCSALATIRPTAEVVSSYRIEAEV